MSSLAEVTFGARAVQRQLRATPENLRQVNAATLLPELSDELDRLDAGRRATQRPKAAVV